jgi:serine/threonine protein kinase
MSIDDIDVGSPGQRFSDFYQLQHQLGKGSFGMVVHATDLVTLEHVAVKVIDKSILNPAKYKEFR